MNDGWWWWWWWWWWRWWWWFMVNDGSIFTLDWRRHHWTCARLEPLHGVKAWYVDEKECPNRVLHHHHHHQQQQHYQHHHHHHHHHHDHIHKQLPWQMMFIHLQGFNDINGLPPDNQTSNGQSPIYRCFFTQLQTSISWWISIAMFDYRRVYHIQSLLYPYDGWYIPTIFHCIPISFQ